jgi:hypothetical protein
MVNDVAGQLGLFVGWSVLTACEMLCLVVMIIKYACTCTKPQLPEEDHELNSATDDSAMEDENGQCMTLASSMRKP